VKNGLSDKCAVVGIGATDFSKDSGRTELRLATECVKAALEDAGLTPADVDGLATFTMDSNIEIEVARNLGIPSLRYFSRVHYGGGAACAIVHLAAMAVATGSADVVVCYRAFNERSWRRFGSGTHVRPPEPVAETIHQSWYRPFGLLTPASWVAMLAQRYMHEYGATSEDFGRVSVSARRFAATNPNAWFYERPITLEDHQSSRWIVEPLRLLDCCQESDGGVAIVVTSTERARDMRNAPAVIRASSMAAGPDQESMTSYYRDDLAQVPEVELVGRELWETSGLRPDDIQTAIIYDAFTPIVPFQLEGFGFCGPGEAPAFIADGNLDMGGRLPTNTHGGQVGEAYIHGINGIAEGVRQIRGTAVNQVDKVDHVLVTAGVGVPTSGLILGRA